MHIAVLSTSFRQPSLTLAAARAVCARLEVDHDVTLLDAATLGSVPLVGVDTGTHDRTAAAHIVATLAAADAVVIGAPLYRASVSGAAKALIDVFGDHLAGTPVGVFVAAGGAGSYFAVADLDRPLALDLGCPIAPHRLLVTSTDTEDDERRLDEFVTAFGRFAQQSRIAAVGA